MNKYMYSAHLGRPFLSLISDFWPKAVSTKSV